MLEIIQAIIVVAIMFIFSFYILKNLIKKIDQNVKRYFLQTLQEYNYLIEEKEKEYEEIKQRLKLIKEKSKIVEMLEVDNKDILFDVEIEDKLLRMKEYKEKIRVKEHEENIEANIVDMKQPKYKEEGFFYNYKELKKQFNIDNREIIEKFIERKVNKKGSITEIKNYNLLRKYKEQFSSKVIYDLLTFTNEEQYQLIKEVTTKTQEKLIGFEEKFSDISKFTVTKLVDYIETILKQYDPTIYIYVGIKDLNYDSINKYIKTCFYKNMSEGIMIIYKGQIYDYSI